MKIVDRDDNSITILKNGKVILKLSSEDKVRRIGTFKNNTYVKSDNVIHWSTNSWSVPYEIFKIADKLMIVSKDFTYTINTEDINPDILHFKDAGIEKKVYIPLELWNKSLRI